MENNNSSMTASVCLFARAYHSTYDSPKIFDDYLARQLLTDEEFLQISEHMANGISFFCPDGADKFSTKQEALKWVVQTQLAPTTLARGVL
jgi:O-methyltransferase involved in polyketide biosynthesis